MKVHLSFLCAAVFLSQLSLTGTARADSLAGTWSGSGYVAPSESARESVRCRITYTQQSAKVYGVVARCASKSEKVVQTGEVLQVSPTRYVGDFYNAEFDISGRVRINVNGRSQFVTFSSSRGGGAVTLSKR